MTGVHDTNSGGCSFKPQTAIKPRTVRVNGVVIPREAIARETQNHPASRPTEAWQAAARALVLRELLLQEARRLNIVATPLLDDQGRRETDDEARIRGLLECAVSVPAAEETELRRYYENNRKAFTAPALFAVSHILIARREATPAARETAREKAAAILTRLQADPRLFARLAQAHSDCPSRAFGGQLGQISTGQTVPEFEAILPVLPVGAEHVSMVESRYGFHLVTVHQRVEEAVLPFEPLRERIEGFLDSRARIMAERHYVQRLASRAEIEGFALEASATPLVQ
jgi:peptidyl-prolyl cis-trans isomerase C